MDNSEPLKGDEPLVTTATDSPQPPAQPLPQPQISPPPQAIVGNVSPESNSPKNKKKWVLLVVGIVVIILVVVAAVLFLNAKDKNNSANTATQKPAQQSKQSSSTTTPATDETASWKTYSDSLITLKYPAGWTIKQDPTADPGNFNITAPGATDSCYLGEDASTDNAKTNDSKAYWQEAYGGSGKVTSENSNSINGYDTYNVESTDPTGATTYSIIGKSGVKIGFYYPSSDKNKDTYDKIIKTIHLN